MVAIFTVLGLLTGGGIALSGLLIGYQLGREDAKGISHDHGFW